MNRNDFDNDVYEMLMWGMEEAHVSDVFIKVDYLNWK